MTEPLVHPTAVIHASAELHPSVRVEPYAVIGPHVRLMENVTVGPHAVVTGHTTLESGVRVFQFASVGEEPQDLKYKGEPTKLFVGANTCIREYVSIHRGTPSGRGETRVGKGCLIMANAHVAHDCIVEDEVIMANSAALAGHVTVGTQVIISGLVGVHQFSRVGRNAFLAGGAVVVEDVMPFCFAQGDRATLRGLNVEGLRRRGYGPDRIAAIKTAYRILFREKRTLADAMEVLGSQVATEDQRLMIGFVQSAHKRALMRP
jgi:UDP-N-acetylglucosamine acyltransferase